MPDTQTSIFIPTDVKAQRFQQYLRKADFFLGREAPDRVWRSGRAPSVRRLSKNDVPLKFKTPSLYPETLDRRAEVVIPIKRCRTAKWTSATTGGLLRAPPVTGLWVVTVLDRIVSTRGAAAITGITGITGIMGRD